jgi:hypothetical protein
MKTGCLLCALLSLALLSACGVLEVGIEPDPSRTIMPQASETATRAAIPATATPAPATETAAPPTNTVERPATATPTPSTQASEVSEPSLWIDYRDAYGYGLALPCFWQIVPPPEEALGGAPIVASYDELYAMAHSVRGHWIDGVWPPGAVKIDVIVFQDVDPTLSLEGAVRSRLTNDRIESTEEVLLGEHHALSVVLEDQPGQPLGANRVHVVRLSPSSFILFSVLPRRALETPTVQGILASLARSPDEAVSIPSFQPEGPVEGREVYVHAEAGYCFQYPSEYTLQEHASSQPAFVGQVANLELERPLYEVGLSVEVLPVSAGAELEDRVDAFLNRFDEQARSAIRREPSRLGGERAEVVTGIPGHEGAQDVFVLHAAKLYHLSYISSSADHDQALADLSALSGIVAGSFSFLPERAPSFEVPPMDLCRAHLGLSIRQGEVEGEAVATSYRCHSAFIDSTGHSPSSSAELVARLGTPIRLQLQAEQRPSEIDVRLYPGAGLAATFMRWPEELPMQAEMADRFQPEPNTAFEYTPQVPAGLYSLVARVSWGEDIVVFYGVSLTLEDAGP